MTPDTHCASASSWGQLGPVGQVCAGSGDSEIWKVASSFLTDCITFRHLILTDVFLLVHPGSGVGRVGGGLSSPRARAMLNTYLLYPTAWETQTR